MKYKQCQPLSLKTMCISFIWSDVKNKPSPKLLSIVWMAFKYGIVAIRTVHFKRLKYKTISIRLYNRCIVDSAVIKCS